MNAASQDEPQLTLPNMDLPLGLRLRRAREAAGLSVQEAAEKLRLKTATIEAIEKEDFDALGAGVYVRGYFNSYARLLGVPTVLVESRFARQPAPVPELQTTARVSHTRYLFDRYAKRAVYVVLTASIVVPVILLATRDQLPQAGATLTPLDAPLDAPRDAAGAAQEGVAATASATTDTIPVDTSPRSGGDAPVMASLGPFYRAPVAAPEASVPVAPVAQAPVADASGLSLHLTGDSWIEVIGADGRRLEHGLLRAGTARSFPTGAVSRVSIGNAEAVEVRLNGEKTDIDAFRRANVARFTVSSDGSLSATGG
jgi:cytoskeleton protein RodZ